MPPVGFFLLTDSWVFPLWSIFVLYSSFFVLHVTYGPQPSFYSTTQTSMPSVGFEPTILVSERPKTHSLDRTATGIGSRPNRPSYIWRSGAYVCVCGGGGAWGFSLTSRVNS
jgi:hypothetical protein